MILKNNKEVGFIYKNNQNIDKLLNNGNLIFEQGFTREDSGVPPLTTSHLTTGKNLKGYKVYGNSIQDGTPTPSAPIEIESVGDKTINLFSRENVTTGKVLAWLTGRESGSSAAANDIITPYLLIDELSYLNSNYNFAVFFYDDNKNYLGNSEDVRQTTGIYYGSDRGAISISSAISSNPNIKYYRVWYRSSVNNNIDFKEITDIMLYNSNEEIDNYEPYGKYKIPISISSAANKNLFWLKDATNVSALNQIYNCSNQTFTKEITNLVGMTYIISNAAFSQICYCEPLQSGKTYIWKFHNANLLSTGHYFTLTYEDETTENWYENTPITLTKNATITAIRQAYRDYTKDETESFQIQVEEGSVATDYEPYYPPVNIYLDEPLRKIGDYADYIDYKNQKIIRTIEEKIITGTEAWSEVSGSSKKYYRFSIGNYGYAISSQGLCNNYMQNSITSTTTVVGFDVGNVTSLNKSVIAIRPENVANYTVETFKQYLADEYNNGRPIIVYYPLATPTEESITLPIIPSIKGTTIYSVGTNIQPSNMYIKYKGR